MGVDKTLLINCPINILLLLADRASEHLFFSQGIFLMKNMDSKLSKEDSLCDFSHHLNGTLRLAQAIDDLASYRKVMDNLGVNYDARIKAASQRVEIPTEESWRFQQLNQNLKNHIEYIQECQGQDLIDRWLRKFHESGGTSNKNK